MSTPINEITNSDDKVFRELQKELNKLPIGFPQTEKGIEINILKRFFSVREAQIALNLSMMLEPLWVIYLRIKHSGSSQIKSISYKELRSILNELGEKGAIISKRRLNGKIRLYSKAMLAIGIYEFQAKRLTQDFVRDLDDYWDEEFGKDMWSTKINQLRVIPIEKSIETTKYVKSYDDVRKLITKSKAKMGVTRCVCRDGKDLQGEPCKVTDERENCLVFAGVADYYLDHGLAREISKDEVFDILDKAEKDGLVLQPGNSQNLNFICTCCSCCCEVLRHLKHSDKPTEYYNSEFVAKINQDECVHCGICLKRCQMNAIYIYNESDTINANKKSNTYLVNPERCIGCGLCVSSCAKHAIQLEKNPNHEAPPWKMTSLNMKIYRKKFGWKKFLLAWLKYIFFIKV